MRRLLSVLALVLFACDQRNGGASSGSTEDARAVSPPEEAGSEAGQGEGERQRFSADCEARGLGGPRLEACVDSKLAIARPPRCPPYPPPRILQYDAECPVLAERDVSRTGRILASVLALDAETKRAVSELFAEHRRPFLDCYSAALRADPSLAGTVHLDFVVDAQGGLSSIRAKSRTIDDSFMLDCVVRVAASFRTNVHADQPVDVAADLVFSP